MLKKNSLKYRKAQILIQKEVENWRNQIKTEPLIIENIGKISFSQNKNDFTYHPHYLLRALKELHIDFEKE